MASPLASKPFRYWKDADGDALLSHVSGWINAKAPPYNAKGDGVADDTAALQAAIDDSPGKKLSIPPGIYNITSPLVLSSANAGYHIEGGSRPYSAMTGVAGGALIKNLNTARQNAFQIVNIGNGGAETALRRLNIQGNPQSGHGIYAQTSGPLTIEDVWCVNHGGIGIFLYRNWTARLHRAACVANQNHGLYVYDQGNNVVVRDGVFNGNGRIGNGQGYANIMFDAESASYANLQVLLQGNDIEGPSADFGLVLKNTRAATVQSNYFENGAQAIFYCDSTVSGLQLLTNYFQDGLVQVARPSGTLVKGNHCLAWSRNTTLQVDGVIGSELETQGNRFESFNGFTAGYSFPSGPAAAGYGEPTWNVAALQNSWAVLGAETPGYLVDAAGTVHLTGSVQGGVLDQAIFTLPAGYRPAYNPYFAVASNSAFGMVQVTNDGRVIARAPSSNASVVLAGISFRAEL